MSDPYGATLLVSAAGPGAISPDTPILGMPLARRSALAAARAGFAHVIFERPPDCDLGPVLAGTGAEIAEPGSHSLSEGSERTVVIPSNALVTISWLEAAAGGEAVPATGSKFEISSVEDVPAAERWLLQSLIKDEEGFMSRHVERRISLAISRRLAGTRVTPNAMTLVSVAVGLVGAALFASPRPGAPFVGALLFLLHSILDGCDGELARLRFQESRFGGMLDFWGDNLVHSAVFAGIAVGWARSIEALWPLAVGAAAIAGTILSAGFVYFRAMAGKAAHEPQFTSVSRGPATRLSRLAGALARRDFIYLVVLLAAFGKAHWFLALAAVGAPIFFLVLVVIDASGRRLGRSFS